MKCVTGFADRLVYVLLACLIISKCVCVRVRVGSGHSLEAGTMAFLCLEVQVAVETQS